MTDSTTRYRVTLESPDGDWHEWEYEIEDSVINDAHRLESYRLPLDELPDSLRKFSEDDLVGCEFIASNDDGDGIGGPIERFENNGTVVVLDKDHPTAKWGDDFGDKAGLTGPGAQQVP